jgi:co-chaperonin GroES (HSP10)
MIKPVNGTIILKPVEEVEETVGNIILPDLGKEKARLGEVVSVSGTYNFHSDTWIAPDIKIGDIAFIAAMAGQKITYDYEEYIACKWQDIIAIIDK